MICGGQPGGAKIKDMAPQHFATNEPQMDHKWTTNGPQMDHKSGRILLCSSAFCFAFKISRHQFSTKSIGPPDPWLPWPSQSMVTNAQRRSVAARWLWQRHCWRRRFCWNSGGSSLDSPPPTVGSRLAPLDGFFFRGNFEADSEEPRFHG